MPYKTKSGSHYHETFGCHGATIPCDTKGLSPCSDCCGHSGNQDGSGLSGGIPTITETGERLSYEALQTFATDGVDIRLSAETLTRIEEDGDLESYLALAACSSTEVAIDDIQEGDRNPDGSVTFHVRGEYMGTREDYLAVDDEDNHDSRVTGASVQSPLRTSEVLATGGVNGAVKGLSAPSGDVAVDGKGLTKADETLRRQVGYRCELLFGEGYTEAAPVLAHETFVLQNTDILRHLGEGVLSGTEAAEKMLHIADVMDGIAEDTEVSEFLDRCYDDQDECREGTDFFQDIVLTSVKEQTGHDIRHVLWLCDCPEDVIDAYGMIEDITVDDIDEHEVGEVLLSDIGGDGKLWGYEHEIERPDTDVWW